MLLGLTFPPLPSPPLPCSSQCSIHTVRVKHAHTDRVTDTDRYRRTASLRFYCAVAVFFISHRISSALTASRMRRKRREAQIRLPCIVRCSERREDGQWCVWSIYLYCIVLHYTLLYSTVLDCLHCKREWWIEQSA